MCDAVANLSPRLAVVAIGRNEGERLKRCLTSARDGATLVVYVDSGSTDQSQGMACTLGAKVVELDPTRPFTAARARNAGFDRVFETDPTVSFVQFVDGDCELETGWLATAAAFLDQNHEVAAVFGRRRERFPDQSVYNRLCDIEWAVPAGKVRYCGGDVMMRADAFKAVGGYRPDFIAGEEPELCVRLRRDGWQIVCLDQPMTIHDAAMTRLSQWWRRTQRSGHAFAQGADVHGGAPDYHWLQEARRAVTWGIVLPCAIIAASALVSPYVLALAAIYPAQIARLYRTQRKKNTYPLLTSTSLVLGRFPEAAGWLTYHVSKLRGRTTKLIEYK